MFGTDRQDQNRKTPLSDLEKQAIADSLAKMLKVQIAFAFLDRVEMSEVEVRRGQINGKALGYVYGFIDAALQNIHQDIADVPVGIPILYQVLRQLFPGREAGYVDFLASHERDKAVTYGMVQGGQQFIDYVANPNPPGRPMGFARLLSEGSRESV